MADKIGPTFVAELIAAGCSEGAVWDPVKGILMGSPTNTQKAVLAAHDPTKTLPLQATVAQLLGALSDTDQATVQAAVDKGTPAVRAWWASHYSDPIPQDSSKIIRIAGKAGKDVSAWFALALNPPTS